MEPVTHMLTGACLARTGLNRRAAYATLAMVVAAEFPDIDTLWSLGGPVLGFQHHRGITHTFVGLPLEAGLIVAAVSGVHWVRVRRAHRTSSASEVAPRPLAGEEMTGQRSRPLTAAPVRWATLYGLTLLALLSHLWLDYTNNYGLRPFFPFNPRWYAASITFIFDPLMFAPLLAALVLPPLFRLISAEVGVRKQPFAARGWSVAALLGVCALWGWRAVEHSRAVNLALAQSVVDPSSYPFSSAADAGIVGGTTEPLPTPSLRYLSAQRALASPDPIDPRRWYTVIDFGPMYELGSVSLATSSFTPANAPWHGKAHGTRDERIASASPLGRVYLDWSPMPFLDERRADAEMPSPDLDDLHRQLAKGSATVTFSDPRFLGEIPWLHIGQSRAPLTGTVDIDPQGNVTRETMDGKVQH